LRVLGMAMTDLEDGLAAFLGHRVSPKTAYSKLRD
jgi:hypothetical protein